MKKVLIIVGILAVVGVGGYFIYDAIWGDYNDAVDQYENILNSY